MTHFFLCQKTPLSQSFSNLHGPRTKSPQPGHAWGQPFVCQPQSLSPSGRTRPCQWVDNLLEVLQIASRPSRPSRSPLPRPIWGISIPLRRRTVQPVAVIHRKKTCLYRWHPRLLHNKNQAYTKADLRQRSSRPDSPDLFKYVSQLPEDGHQICGMFLDFTVPYIHPKIAKKKTKRHNTCVSMHVSICPKFLNGPIDLMRRFQGLRCPYPKKDTSLWEVQQVPKKIDVW